MRAGRAPSTGSRRGGRPSREASARLGERILDAATELFLSRGYGATSIESVAQRAGVAKRTFYHRFPDKAALFAAVVHRIIERLRPPAGVPLVEGANLHAKLERLAALILRAALSPQALALHRLMVAQSAEFPELAGVMAREGAAEEAVRLIAGLLDREAVAGRLVVADAMFAARAFLPMVITQPQRRAMGMGTPMSTEELEAWPHRVVHLFLYGCVGIVPEAPG
jgi:AcrR family transcriptional regulator